MPITIDGTGTISGVSATGITTAQEVANASITPAKLSQPFTSGTAVASTSGTIIDFTSIPSWVKRITFMFDGLSSNGGSSIQIQIGDSGGIETTGYISGNVYGSLTTGFVLAINPVSSYTQHGTMVFTNLSGNAWVQNGCSLADAIAIQPVAGSKTLSATLDRIRLTTVNGTDTFDAGSINILYE
jgi:hypothetical protein